ncbi:MAG: cyclic nucleotide-binding domain-containing protein [Chloroflexota bacterium]
MTAVSTNRLTTGGIWATLLPDRSAAAQDAVDVWSSLEDRLDLGRYVPVPTPGVEVRPVEGQDGRHSWVVRSPAYRYLRLDEADLDLWQRMDGCRTVRDIALAHFVERGGFVADRLGRLVRRLRVDGFLGEPPPDVLAAVDARLRTRSRVGRAVRLLSRVSELELVRFPAADRWFGIAYAGAGWLLYSTPARILWLAIILTGLTAWWRQVLAAEHALFQTNGSYTLGLVTLAALDITGVMVYQGAQALSLKRHGVTITGAGLQVYYGLPLLFVETSDAWMAGRRGRISISLAGPFSVLVLGGALALVAYPLDGTEMGAFLFKAAFVWLVNGAFNLLPILEQDGYFLLVDYLEMPALRSNALTFIRQDLVQRLRARVPLSREEWIYAWYGLFHALLVALIPLLILEARDLRYASSFADLWNRPDPGAHLIATGMMVFLLGPAAFSIVARIGWTLLAVSQALTMRWRRFRGRVPREHLEALARLPFLAGLSRSELRSIGIHLRSERVEAGHVILRQGAHGDRFYLVLEGDVQVVRVAANEQTEQLALLGPGDYFGEAALVANVPRTATVIAVTPARLLSLDAGHFRRWLAGRVDLGKAVHRSMVERDRLAALPLFAGVGSRELDRVAARMLVTRYSAGDTIVEQGGVGDRFFVIADGSVEVVRMKAETGEEAIIAHLGVGDFFGEMALLDDAPRTATVRARSPVETFTLAREDFAHLLERPPTEALVRTTAGRRASELGRSVR